MGCGYCIGVIIANVATRNTCVLERHRYNVRDRVESLTTAPTYDPEFVSYEHLMFKEKQDYDASAFKYEKKADLCLRNQNVVVLGGYGLVTFAIITPMQYPHPIRY